MSDGNKRYLGDVFINSENYERQKQFFKDIIESYQWKYGGSFDASTLQGKVPGDFATKEQGKKADIAILSPLLLGKTEIVNSGESQYILTDATRLDDENEELMAVPWFSVLNENADLSEALIAIYSNVTTIETALQNNIDEKLDEKTYNDFFNDDYTPFKNQFADVFQPAIDLNGQEITLLNAGLINGLRFILITQAAYDALEDNVKSFWRNIFIIRDPSEIPADYHSPLQLDLTDGYQFRIGIGTDGKHYLQVSNGLNDEWKNICSLEKLLDGANFNEIIKNFIENQDYLAKDTSVLNSLKNIEFYTIDEDWEEYPFLSSSLHDTYVKDIKINGTSTNVTSTVDPASKFKTVNLDINTIVNGLLSPVKADITTTQSNVSSNTNRISTVEGNISTINGQINSLQSADIVNTTNINTLGDNFRGLSNNFAIFQQNTNNKITDIKTWNTYYPHGLVLRPKNNVSLAPTQRSRNYYNKELRLGMLYCDFLHYHYMDKVEQWVDAVWYNINGTPTTYKTKYNSGGDYVGGFIYAPPVAPIVFPCSNNPNNLIKIETEEYKPGHFKGYVQVWIGEGSSGLIEIEGYSPLYLTRSPSQFALDDDGVGDYERSLL